VTTLKAILVASLASLVLAGCGTAGSAVPMVDKDMVAKVNADLAISLSDTDVQAMADKTCRDFAHLYTVESINNYINGFAAMNTHNGSYKAGHALGVMLGTNCPATASRILHTIKG